VSASAVTPHSDLFVVFLPFFFLLSSLLPFFFQLAVKTLVKERIQHKTTV
jgi:hypothetical protein